MTTQRLRKLCRLLRRDFAPNAPVRVIRQPMERDLYGLTDKAGKGYYIRLNNTLVREVQEQTLLHEWAHVLTWDVGEKHHCERWAAKFAEIIRWYQGEDEFDHD